MSKINLKNKTSYENEVKLNIEKTVMGKIRSDEIKMKPKWLFIVGSVSTIAGLIGLIAGAMFFTNLTVFLIKKRGPGYGKLDLMFSSFPIWIPVLAVLGIILGILILKKYDFSYKKNFLLIILFFIISVLITGLLIDQLGLNDIWSHQGPMRRFYQQIENRGDVLPMGQRGQERMQKK